MYMTAERVSVEHDLSSFEQEFTSTSSFPAQSLFNAFLQAEFSLAFKTVLIVLRKWLV